MTRLDTKVSNTTDQSTV